MKYYAGRQGSLKNVTLVANTTERIDKASIANGTPVMFLYAKHTNKL